MHDVFHVSQLKTAVGQSTAGVPSEEFRPPGDDQGEFEVGDLFDHCTCRCVSASGLEYLVKWKGYSVFEATQEPAKSYQLF